MLLSMSLQFRRNIDVWSVSSADNRSSSHLPVRPDPGFTDVAAFLASWRPLYSIYRDFHQIGDEEVIATLKRFPTNRVVHASDGS